MGANDDTRTIARSDFPMSNVEVRSVIQSDVADAASEIVKEQQTRLGEMSAMNARESGDEMS